MSINYNSNTPAVYTPQQTYVSQYAPLDTRAIMAGMRQYRNEIDKGQQNRTKFQGALSSVNSIKEMDDIRRERLTYYNDKSAEIAKRAASKELNPYEVNREINALAQEFDVDQDVRALEYTYAQKQEFDKQWGKMKPQERRKYNNNYANWLDSKRGEEGFNFRDQQGNLGVFDSGNIQKAVEYDTKFKSDISGIAEDKKVWSSLRDQGDSILKQRGYREAVSGNKLKGVSNKLALNALNAQEGRQYVEDVVGKNLGVDAINNIEDGTMIIEEDGQLVAYDQQGNKVDESVSAKLFAANKLAENYYNMGYKQLFTSGGVSNTDLSFKPKHILEPEKQLRNDFFVSRGEDFQGQGQLDLNELSTRQRQAYRDGNFEESDRLWNQQKRVLEATRRTNPALDQKVKDFREKHPNLPENFEMDLFTNSFNRQAFGPGGEVQDEFMYKALLGEDYEEGESWQDSQQKVEDKYGIDYSHGGGGELSEIADVIQGQLRQGLEDKAFDLVEDLNGNSNLVTYTGVALKSNDFTDKVSNYLSDGIPWKLKDEDGKLSNVPENDKEFKFNTSNLKGWELSGAPVGESFIMKANDPKMNKDFYKEIPFDSPVLSGIANQYEKTAMSFQQDGDIAMAKEAYTAAWKIRNGRKVKELNSLKPFESTSVDMLGGNATVETTMGNSGDLVYKLTYLDKNNNEVEKVLNSRDNLYLALSITGR